VFYGILIAVFGVALIPYIVISAVFGFTLLETVNYLEHYGLLRQKLESGRYERCAPVHSWNSDHIVTNLFLYHLQRHSDHHANPTRRYQALRDFPEAPVLPTGYAGMIVLAREIAGGDEPVLPLLDVTVERNAFGRQLGSFEADLQVPVLGDQPVHGVFIRAPVIDRTGPDVDILARLDDGRIVAVRERNVIATAFHPELAGETRFHRLVATMAAEHDEPGEGAGRRRHPTRRSRAGA